ncbi:hypothetical protein QYF61_019290 [Mycteria americana]|uniref:Keratin n=1 Tax=Mycteria americana TaxID=33587 RepID=A0AAN7RUV6_MYCAM|nr:hypothetical protein QYF61_019290 [Mycteria americana]
MCCEKRLREQELLRQEKRRLMGILSMCKNNCWEGVKTTETNSCQWYSVKGQEEMGINCPSASSGPTSLASSCSEPCVAHCADSPVAFQASPVVVTLPDLILTSFPQSTAVGSSLSAAVGSSLSAGGVPISSGGPIGLEAGSGLCLISPPLHCTLS